MVSVRRILGDYHIFHLFYMGPPPPGKTNALFKNQLEGTTCSLPTKWGVGSINKRWLQRRLQNTALKQQQQKTSMQCFAFLLNLEPQHQASSEFSMPFQMKNLYNYFFKSI